MSLVPLDRGLGGLQNSLTLGVVWMWNPSIRILLNFVAADVRSGPYGPGDIYYVMLRTQFSF